MNRLSIITVVKNDLSSLKSTHRSINELAIDYEWIVIDGGSDPETSHWMQILVSPHTTYLREQDENLYDAMNKGIKLATGTHLLFINAGDELINSPELIQAFSSLSVDIGFIGCIRRSLGRLTDSFYLVKPGQLLKWTLRNGIKPVNHQATIYPTTFLKSNPYHIEIGLFADQISILELLKTRPVQISRKIVVSTFQNGGLGDNQSRGAFLRQMLKFNFQSGTDLQKLLLILQLPVILLGKVILSIFHRIRILFSR
jgi:glycosyltransferase involved in cell wall biosynthesis